MNKPKIVGFIAEKNVIVFIYRKSSKVHYLVCMKYNKSKETFILGSRFYGKLYPEKCDISPDGRYFLYFAMRGTSQEKYKKEMYCWTAICRPPNITAQFILEHNDTWFGGGRFIDERKLFINSGYEKINTKKFGQYSIVTEGSCGNWEIGKGWKLTETQKSDLKYYNYVVPKYWEKSKGKITIKRKLEYDELYSKRGRFDMYSYTIIDNKTQNEIPLANCTWIDFDNFGRIITGQGSKIVIYKNYSQIKENSPSIIYDLEDLIIKN